MREGDDCPQPPSPFPNHPIPTILYPPKKPKKTTGKTIDGWIPGWFIGEVEEEGVTVGGSDDEGRGYERPTDNIT